MENDRTIFKTLLPVQAQEFTLANWFSNLAKRWADILVALFGLLFLSPVFVLLGILIMMKGMVERWRSARTCWSRS